MLVMEYMHHGSLYDLLHNETVFLEGAMLLQLLRDISQGCRFLHAMDPPVIHRDLAAKNILVDNRFVFLVAHMFYRILGPTKFLEMNSARSYIFCIERLMIQQVPSKSRRFWSI